jgi:hypothetical protein
VGKGGQWHFSKYDPVGEFGSDWRGGGLERYIGYDFESLEEGNDERIEHHQVDDFDNQCEKY